MKIVLLLLPLLILAACAPIQPAAGTLPAPAEEATAPAEETAPAEAAAPAEAVAAPAPFEPQGFIRKIHDPVVAREGDTYTVFSTGGRIIMIQSPDMVNWEWAGRVFEENPDWSREINPNLADIWAPDISYTNGEWRLYYAVSNFGEQNSAIALATNKTLDLSSPDYAWTDHGIVLRSQPGDPYNAIDPNFVLDQEGTGWLAFGSFWDGLFLRRVDLATGMLDASDTTLYPIADRQSSADGGDGIEAAFIVWRAPYYYLFSSFDQCCQGIASTYNTRVVRSESITGPYVDADGVPAMTGGGTLVAAQFDHWFGPGHNAVLIDEGVYWNFYHAYDGHAAGDSKLRIEPISWTDDGWPTLPSQVE